MRIEVKGRNLTITDDLREHVVRRFGKIGKQVAALAVLEVELSVERNPANPDNQVAEATLYLKGVTLRASDASGDLHHSVNLIADELAVQVKRHREKRRNRRGARTADPAPVPLSGVPPAAGDAPGGQLPAV